MAAAPALLASLEHRAALADSNPLRQLVSATIGKPGPLPAIVNSVSNTSANAIGGATAGAPDAAAAHADTDASVGGAAAAEAAATASAKRKMDILSWAGPMGGAEDSEEELEDEEDRMVTDQELGLLTLDQTLAQLPTTAAPALQTSDALVARLEYTVKRRAALAERRALREEEARRRAEEEAARYIEVPLGSEDPNDELAGPLRSGLRGAVLRMRRHGEAGRENMLQQSGFFWWPSSRHRQDQQSASAQGTPAREVATAPPEPSNDSASRHLRFLQRHALTLGVNGQPRFGSGASVTGDGTTSLPTPPPASAYHSMPYRSAPTHYAIPYYSLHLTNNRHGHYLNYLHELQKEASSTTNSMVAVAAGAGAGSGTRAGSGTSVWNASGSRSVSPNQERNRVAWNLQPSSQHTTQGRELPNTASGVDKSAAAAVDLKYNNDEQRQKLEPVLDAWEVVSSGDTELAALGTFKEALQPASWRPPPADMKPFTPLEGEPIRITEQQVSRRLVQAAETGSCVLDLDFGPRLTLGDFGVVYATIKSLSTDAVKGIRAVSGVMTKSAVEGLTALVRARPSIEELELRGNPALGAPAMSRLAPLLHPSMRCRLRRLDLSGCPLGDAGFSSLAANLAENRHLQELLLSGCGLEDAALAVLYQSLALNGSIKLLDLSQNRFSETGMTVLCKDLEDNHSLTRLDLSHCSLPDAAMPALSRVVVLHPALTSLDLSHNCLGWKGCRALAEGLQPQPQPSDPLQATHHHHHDQDPHPHGTPHNQQHPFSFSFPQSRSPSPHHHHHHSHLHHHHYRGPPRPVLRELALDGNPLGQGGVLALMRLLQINSTLKKLSLSNVTLTALPGEPLELDSNHPNGHYSLDLADPEQRKAATTLLSLWHASGGSSWLSANLNNAPVHLPRAAAGCITPAGTGTWPDWVRPHLRWPEAMPNEGTLVVSVRNNASLEPSLLTPPPPPAPPPAPAAAETPLAGADPAAVAAPTAPVVVPPVTLSPALLSVLIQAIDCPAASEVWKTQLLMLATKVAYVTSEQAGRLLGHLRYRAERADAAATLLSATPDLHRAPWALRTYAKFGPDDIAELLQELSLAPLLPLRTRVVNGWDTCCSGHIRLDLAQQSHRLLAILLVQTAQRDSGAPAWATPQAAAPEEDLYGALTARLGDATSCMRDITFSGASLGHSVIYLSSANIPTRGIIDTHFVNVRPRTHVQYPGLGMGKERRQAPSILTGKPAGGSGTAPTSNSGGTPTASTIAAAAAGGGSGGSFPSPTGPAAAAAATAISTNSVGGEAAADSAGTRTSTASSRPTATTTTTTTAPQPPLPAVSAGVVAMESMRMAATALSSSVTLNAVVTKKNWWQPCVTAWEGVFMEALLRLGLSHSHPALAGWRHASNMWKGHYRSFSSRLHAEAHLRHRAYVSAARRRSTHAGDPTEGDAAGKAGKKGGGKKDGGKGGKKGKKSGDADNDDGGGGKAGKKSGGGKKGGKKGGKRGDADGAGGGPWGPGLDAATLRLLGTLEMRARQLAPLMTNLACGVSLSVYQVLHLLRLLPDFELRIKALVALWPAIWDRGNVVDLIVDLDHPVALPPAQHKVGGEGGPTSPIPTSTAGVQGPGSSSVNSQQQQPVVENRRPTLTGGGGGISGAPGSSSIGSSSGAAPRPGSPNRTGQAESLVVKPKNFVPGPHTADELLLKVAAALGWRTLLLCWAYPGSLHGRTLHLHMGAIDQLQAVASICRFADRCYRLLRHQVVSGLACDGTAVDPEEAAELPGGVWQLILSRTVLCLDRPEYGTVSLQLDGITLDAQRAVAAVTIQAVWRGYLVRRAAYAAAVASGGSNRWLRCWQVVKHLRRLALMRTLAADLDISRAQSEMEKGYLRMLYGPNAA
ncbi:hypothetical protein Vretifemale_6644 [Volvox reticuliferus]|uniref:Uncharacterized protein n=1 Tax=Volvox reticuliferus TaxID=1737510 RepID=A0A8J4FLH3_9CHLO|nr:hypothetical protein Vretifemale_6644 [Volvox reticuliferus]